VEAVEFRRRQSKTPMKTYMKNLFLLPALIAGLGLLTAGRVTAQTFTTLHSFTATPFNTNSDGATPYAGLVQSGNTLYGTTYAGGRAGKGSVFAVNTDGTGFTNLYSFSARFGPLSTNTDGARPSDGLVLSSNTLYGTATFGGTAGIGTVFKVNTDGTGFTNLHNFTEAAPPDYINSDGVNPYAGLILLNNTLYGAAAFGGSAGNGTVFAVNTDGTGFTNLHSFAAGSGSFPNTTNTDGANPYGRLILSGNILYGTAADGGSSGAGAVFALNTDGTGFTNLHSFDSFAGEGLNPVAELFLSGNTLYGTTLNGGSSGVGALFKVNTDGTGFTTLYSFTALSGPSPYTNSDGANPRAGLVLSGNTLYGTAEIGGSSTNCVQGCGTVFAVNTDGTGFTNLHNFTNGSDGGSPEARLMLSGNTLYGTAAFGGSSGNGTVFSLSFAPQLTIAVSATNVILSWPISYAGFSYAGYILEDTANLGSPTGWNSVADTNAPVIINGQLRVTRPMLGPQWSYRLRKY